MLEVKKQTGRVKIWNLDTVWDLQRMNSYKAEVGLTFI